MGQRVFGASQFSRIQNSIDSRRKYSGRDSSEDSSRRTETSYRTGLNRFYEKWSNWEELKVRMGLES